MIKRCMWIFMALFMICIFLYILCIYICHSVFRKIFRNASARPSQGLFATPFAQPSQSLSQSETRDNSASRSLSLADHCLDASPPAANTPEARSTLNKSANKRRCGADAMATAKASGLDERFSQNTPDRRCRFLHFT